MASLCWAHDPITWCSCSYQTHIYVCVFLGKALDSEDRSTLVCDYAAAHGAATQLGLPQQSGGGPPSIAAVWSQGSGGNWPSVTSLLPSVQEALAFCVAGNYSRLKVEDCLQGNHTGKFIPPTSPAPTSSAVEEELLHTWI